MHPFRQVIRQFVKAPGFVAVAVLTLAVGIGANAVVFGVAKAVLLRPLGLPDEDQLMWVRLTKARASMSEAALSWSEIEDLRESVPSFAAVATYGISGMVWNDHESGFEVPILRARPELMEVLQVRPRLGRLFATEEYVEKSGVALLTYQGWQSHFGGRSEVLGHQVRLDGVVREVVGVLPEGFGFPLERLPVTGTGAGPLVRQGDQVFWVPMAPPQESDRTSREARMFSVAARLKPGATEAGARAELAVLSSRLAVLYPEANRGLGFDVVSFRDFILGRTRQGLPLLGGAVAAVLLVCCVNLANLLLARGLVRQREWAVRLAMGAARTRLIRDSLMESLALALSAGLVGWAMAAFGLRLLRTLGSASVPFLEEARVDGWVLLFAVGLSTVTAFVFGALPAWHQSRTDAAEALRTGARSSGGPQIQRWQNALLVGQVAAVLVLTLAAGALLESFRRLLGQDLGYQVDPVVTMTLQTRDFETNGELCRFYRRLRERLAALPGIEAVGTISSVPLTGGWTFAERPNVVGRPLPEADRPAVAATFVAFDYFPAMGIALREGRLFLDSELDDDGYGQRVILNESAARLLFPDRSALGGRFTVGSNPDRILEVIGVVQDTRDVRLEEAPVPRFYWQYAFGGAQFMLRTRTDAQALAPLLRDLVVQVDRRTQVQDVRPMTAIVQATVADRRFLMVLVATYAVVALGIAVLGVFGVVSYQVTRRRAEFGVRLALGGLPRHLMYLVLTRTARLALGGAAMGFGVALITNRLLAGHLFGISPYEPALWTLAGVAVFGMALLASAVPARRAARVDPAVVLRDE